MANEWDDWLKGKRRGSLLFPDTNPSPFKSTLFGQHELPGRIRVGNLEGKFNAKALEELGWSKHKLTKLLRYIQENRLTIGKKFIRLVDGTEIRMKEIEGNTRIEIVVPEVGKVEEKRKKRKQREFIRTYPAPVLCCHTFLPSVGNYYSNAVPELFLVMPYFKNITYVLKPRRPDEVSEELYRTYSTYYPNDIYGVWKGKCELDIDNTKTPFNEELPRDEKNKITIRELVNISDVNQAQFDLYGSSSGTSTYDYQPSEDAEDRKTIYTGSSQYEIDVFGSIEESSSWQNFGQSWGNKVGDIWIQYYADALSIGEKLNMDSSVRIITNPGISDHFQSKDSAYMYIVRKRIINNFQQGPEVDGLGENMDTNNDVPERHEYLLRAVAPSYTKEFKIWELNQICWETDVLYRPDIKIYDFHGEPVFLLCWMPNFIGPISPTDPNNDKIRYAMIYKNEVYESEWYPRIGVIDYPHIVYTGGKQTYYSDGYMRLVEIEEKTIIEEDDL